MKDQVFRIEYFPVVLDDRPGVGADIGAKLQKDGINLLAVSAFPVSPGKTQVDYIPENPDAFTKVARKLNLTLTDPKIAFLVQGTDRPGALGDVLQRLGTEKINIRATLGVCAGGNRYGALVWVEPSKVEAASRALGATPMAAHHV